MEELRKAREALLIAVEGLTNEQMNLKPNEQTWSIAQILYHLYLTERIVTKIILKGLTLPDEFIQEQPIDYLLDRSKKVIAPKEVEPKAGYIDNVEMIDKLHFSREVFLKTIHEIPDHTILDRKVMPHLIFGKMKLSQWIDLIHYHEQRHTAQIKEIIASTNL